MSSRLRRQSRRKKTWAIASWKRLAVLSIPIILGGAAWSFPLVREQAARGFRRGIAFSGLLSLLRRW